MVLRPCSLSHRLILQLASLQVLLTCVQPAGEVAGVGSVQRVVCGGCLDFKAQSPRVGGYGLVLGLFWGLGF